MLFDIGLFIVGMLAGAVSTVTVMLVIADRWSKKKAAEKDMV